tara:strand:- start:12603 stop:12758 length:156 start_codon:yes stop_codon:yes gene_type:complete
MTFYILLIITVVVAYVIAVYQKIRGLKFWSSFFKSLIAVSGVLGTIWKVLG